MEETTEPTPPDVEPDNPMDDMVRDAITHGRLQTAALFSIRNWLMICALLLLLIGSRLDNLIKFGKES